MKSLFLSAVTVGLATFLMARPLSRAADDAVDAAPGKAVPPVVHTAKFGPVLERVLLFDGRKREAYLDLDTGKHLGPQVKIPPIGEGTPAGVDLRARDYESHTLARFAVNMALKPVETNRWDATPAEVRKELARTRREAEVRLLASEAPQVFFFRTSEGGTGILEISGGGSDRSGWDQVRVRFKLIQDSFEPGPK